MFERKQAVGDGRPVGGRAGQRAADRIAALLANTDGEGIPESVPFNRFSRTGFCVLDDAAREAFR
jgi:hypothetical protein